MSILNELDTVAKDNMINAIEWLEEFWMELKKDLYSDSPDDFISASIALMVIKRFHLHEFQQKFLSFSKVVRSNHESYDIPNNVFSLVEKLDKE